MTVTVQMTTTSSIAVTREIISATTTNHTRGLQTSTMTVTVQMRTTSSIAVTREIISATTTNHTCEQPAVLLSPERLSVLQRPITHEVYRLAR